MCEAEKKLVEILEMLAPYINGNGKHKYAKLLAMDIIRRCFGCVKGDK